MHLKDALRPAVVKRLYTRGQVQMPFSGCLVRITRICWRKAEPKICFTRMCWLRLFLTSYELDSGMPNNRHE